MPAIDTATTHTIDLGHGIYAIDTGFHRERFDAAYLLIEDGHAAFIDTGTNFSVPRLLASLELLGLSVDQVDWVIPTHVHLDHAGGVGMLMAALPRARLLVHPRGARHMIDPSALYQGALAVYGQAEMERAYGTLLGVPAERVVESHDEMVIHLGDRPLRLIDTPGHARHHHAIWDARSQGWFTGDTFGLSYREFDTDQGAWIMPTSTPVQFEPQALRASVERMMAAQPEHLYLTHFSRVSNVPRLGRLFLDLLDQTVAISTALAHAPDRHQALKAALRDLYLRSLRQHGVTLPDATIDDWLSMDIELNAQGIGIWLDKTMPSA
jgi:glyoxylase-like metal-dependent hydrolase (beta-lactamase superfamily II)